MATVSSPPIDLSESVEQARNAVSGKLPHEALRAFANVHGISVKKLRESAIESLSRSPSAGNLRLDHAMTIHGNRRVLAHSACNSTRTLERRSASRSVCRTAASQSTDQAATPLLETSVAKESSRKLSTHR